MTDNRTIRLSDAIEAAPCTARKPRANAYDSGFFDATIAYQKALSALPAVDGWLPIESAPRDGTPLDLWIVFPDGGRRWPNAKWMLAGEHSCTGPANWCSQGKFPLHAFTEKPIATHWQPLPAPPIE